MEDDQSLISRDRQEIRDSMKKVSMDGDHIEVYTFKIPTNIQKHIDEALKRGQKEWEYENSSYWMRWLHWFRSLRIFNKRS